MMCCSWLIRGLCDPWDDWLELNVVLDEIEGYIGLVLIGSGLIKVKSEENGGIFSPFSHEMMSWVSFNFSKHEAKYGWLLAIS